jgi:glutathione reductase (NADPH)
LIWAIGRKPATEAINLNKTQVQLNENRFIHVDAYQNTTQSGIYAVGDITGKVELLLLWQRVEDCLNVYLTISQMNI